MLVAACGSIGPGGIPIQRDLEDPMAVAVGEVAGCPVISEVEVDVPHPAAVDAAYDGAGGVPMLIELAGGAALFVGSAELAASELGGKALFVGRDGELWLRLEPGLARRVLAVETPKGRSGWYLEDTATIEPC